MCCIAHAQGHEMSLPSPLLAAWLLVIQVHTQENTICTICASCFVQRVHLPDIARFFCNSTLHQCRYALAAPSSAPTSVQLAEALVAFLEAALHQILCVRRVYPACTFRRLRRFGQLSWWSQSTALSAYLRNICDSLKEVLQRQLLYRLMLVLLDENNHECERYIFEFTPLLTQAATASTSCPPLWSGRAESPDIFAPAGQASPSDASKPYCLKRRTENSNISDSSTIHTAARPSSSAFGFTYSPVPTSKCYDSSSGSTPLGLRSTTEVGNGGSRIWRRLCVAFQDILTKLELVGCWLDADDTGEEGDDDTEDSLSEGGSLEASAERTGEAKEMPEQAVATGCAPALSSTAAFSSLARNSVTSANVERNLSEGNHGGAAQCDGDAVANSPILGRLEDAAGATRAKYGGGCSAGLPAQATAEGEAQGHISQKRPGRSSVLHKQRCIQYSAKTFRIQLQQDAEVLETLDATAASIPRPLSCLDEDLRAMLLLRSRWLPSIKDNNCGEPHRTTQPTGSRWSFAAALLSNQAPGQTRANPGRNSRSQGSREIGDHSRRRKGEGTPVINSFVLASVPRSIILSWEPRPTVGRAPSPVPPRAHPFGCSSATLLRIIVEQHQKRLSSSTAQKRKKRRSVFCLHSHTRDNVALMTAATADDATLAGMPFKRMRKAATESSCIDKRTQSPYMTLSQRASEATETDGVGQHATARADGCSQEKQMRQEERLHLLMGQQLNMRVSDVSEVEKFKQVRDDLPELQQKVGDSAVPMTGTEQEQAGRSIISCGLPQSTMDTHMEDTISGSSMSSSRTNEANASVELVTRESSSIGTQSSATDVSQSRAVTAIPEEKLFPEDAIALLYDTELDSLF